MHIFIHWSNEAAPHNRICFLPSCRTDRDHPIFLRTMNIWRLSHDARVKYELRYQNELLSHQQREWECLHCRSRLPKNQNSRGLWCSHREWLNSVAVSIGEAYPKSLRGVDIIIPRPFGTVLQAPCSISNYRASIPKSIVHFQSCK